MSFEVSPTTSNVQEDGQETETHTQAPPQPAAESLVDWHKQLYTLMCKEYYEQLGRLLDALNYQRFFVAFDECTALGIAFGSAPHDRMTLLALQRILLQTDHEFSGVQFWYFVLDTTSSYPVLAPSGPLAASSRLRGEMTMLPPWIYMGFNQLIRADKLAKISSAASALLLRYLAQNGRPVRVWFSSANVHERSDFLSSIGIHLGTILLHLLAESCSVPTASIL